MFFSEQKSQFKSFTRRTLFLLIGKLGLLSFVGFKLFDLQVLKSDKYKTLSKNNRISIKIIFPIRGIITDRNNNIIAKNYETYDLYIIPEEIYDLEQTLNKLSEIEKIPFKSKKKGYYFVKKSKKI